MRVVLWTLAWLFVVDATINVAFDPHRHWPSRLQALPRYFEYGRSIEGKLTQALGPRADRPNSLTAAGWIDPAQWVDLPTVPLAGADLLVAIYGQSFAFNASQAMAAIDGRMTLRMIGAPAAPLSHSFAAYRADAPGRRADVVVVGILASSLIHSGSISALSWTFESPAPYTFPKFGVDAGELTEIVPRLKTEAEFRRAFRERDGAWRDFIEQLRIHDAGYDAFTFGELGSGLDYSALARLVRRGWVTSQQSQSDPERRSVVTTALALLQRWQGLCDASGERLVVLLLQDRSDLSLTGELAPMLRSFGIDFVSSESLFSASDPSNFVADGHYSEAANRRLAETLRSEVRSAAARRREMRASRERSIRDTPSSR